MSTTNPPPLARASAQSASESRELSLVSTVELRIASARSTKSQLQPLITTYLVPLLLKLASPHASVRAKTREACQRILVRLGSISGRDAASGPGSGQAEEEDIEIPVRKLVGQFRALGSGKTADDGGTVLGDKGLRDDIRRFSLVFIRMGLSRMKLPADSTEAMELLNCLLTIPGSMRKSSADASTPTYRGGEEGKGRGKGKGEVQEIERDLGDREEIRPRVHEEDMSLNTRLYLCGLHFLLKVISTPSFPLPGRNTKADTELKAGLDLNLAESICLASYLTKFLVADSQAFYAPQTININARNTSGSDRARNSFPSQSPSPLPGLTASERLIFRTWILRMKGQDQESRPAIEQLISSTKVAVAKFLFTSVFDDRQRFMPAVVMTADDTSLALFRTGDTMFKQCEFDLEGEELVDGLYELYFGRRPSYSGENMQIDAENGEPNGIEQNEQEETQLTLPARPKLQIRILVLLAKSRVATRRTYRVWDIVQQQFSQVTDFGREATKLRAAALSLLNWVSRIGTTADVSAIADKVTGAFRGYIDDQGWPDPTKVTAKHMSGPELELRAKAYEDIGVWAARMDFNRAAETTGEKVEDIKIALIRFLLTSLSCDASSLDIQVSIDSALGRLLNVFADSDSTNEQMTNPLRELLMLQMSKEIGDHDDTIGFKIVRSTKFPAVRFANRCLSFDDCAARWIDLLAIGEGQLGERNELVEEGTKGLDPHWWLTANRSKQNTGHIAAATVSSSQLMFPRFDQLVEYFFHGENGRKMTQVSKQNRIYNFALASAVKFCRNILILEAVRASTTDKLMNIDLDWERKVEVMVSTDEKIRTSIRSHFREKVDRSALKTLVEVALTGMSLQLHQCADIAIGICCLVPDDVVRGMLHHVAMIQPISVSNDLAAQSQAARVLGIFASQSDFPKPEREELIETALSTIQGWREAVGQELNRTRGLMLSVAFVLSRQALRRSVLGENDVVARFLSLAEEIILESRDAALQSGAHISLGQLMLCIDAPSGQYSDLLSEGLAEELKKHANKGQESAIIALGRLIRGLDSSEAPSQMTEKALESLLSLHEMKRSEMQFAVGEALSVAAAGWLSGATTAELDVDVPRPSRGVNESMLEMLLDKVIADTNNTKPSLKKASAIWLLCLVQYLGEQPILQARLRQCQAAFAKLLTNRDEMVQETGSRGLSLVYEMGNKDLKDELVRELVASFTSGSAKMGGMVTSDTQLFEPGALPTGDGSVTTYKDIVSLASEMGDPSLVYRFMNLASNNAIWTSRSAFGRFGLGNVLADSSYLAENKNFYPKLYRYRFDPNPNVQRSMNDIWNALVKDSTSVVDENFDGIIDDLLKGLVNGKEWRIRQASCAAISEILHGRDVEKYEKYLNDIWTKAFKVLDDIKETVRVAAMGLCRTLTNLLIRNLEVGSGTTNRAQKLLDYAMQFLLQQMQSGSAREVQEYATQTLLKIIKKSPPRALKDYAPTIVETLISSMTSLEPEAVNYVHLNADKYGLSAEKLDSARVSGVSSSPAMRAVERCIEGLDERSMSEVMKKLRDSFKSVIGLPSKVGLSSLLVTLVVRHGFDFRPYADGFAQLLRKHLFDRNETVVNSYCLSLAYLMRLASDDEVVTTAEFAKNLYFRSEGFEHRRIAGDIVRAISKASNDKFIAFASAFLPLAFIGRNDINSEVREPFETTWKDNVGGSRAIALYLMEIIDLAQHIDSPQWGIKHTVCLAISDLISSLDAVLNGDCTHRQATAIWSLLEKALGGKTWEGKEKVVASLPKFVKKAPILWETHRPQFEAIAIREAKRTNSTYRPDAIRALGDIVKIFKSQGLAGKTLEVMLAVVEELLDASEDPMEVDGDKVSLGLERQRQADLDKTLAAVIQTCFNAVVFSSGGRQAMSNNLVSLRNILDKSVHRSSGLGYMATCEGIAKLLVEFTEAPGQEAKGEEVERRSALLDDEETLMELANYLLPTISPRPGSQGTSALPYTVDPQPLLLARANAVAPFVKTTAASLSAGNQVKISSAIKEWLDVERHGPVREALNDARRRISTSTP